MDVYFRSCPRDVRVTTLIFIPSLNTKMSFIVLEKGIFLEDLPSVSRPDADLKIGPLSPRFRMSVWDPLLEHLVFLFFCFLIQEYCRMSHLVGNRHHDLSGERRTARARPTDGRP
jgi:hypothetical protein